jgi:hypothetical protein
MVGGIAIVVLYVLPKVIRGIFTNKNILTNNQTDAQGNQVTAYSDTQTPVIGTLGAAANTVSGGVLASIGEWLGNTVADITMPYDPNAPASGVNRAQVVAPNYVNDIDQLSVPQSDTWQ